MKLIIDMNLSPRWQAHLADAGFDAAHWSQLGRPDAPDAEIMRYAAEAGAVVLTHDLDFGTILAASGDHSPSVVVIRSDTLDIARIGPQVLAALRQFNDMLAAGALVSVHPQRTRVRMLPLWRAAQ